MSCTRKRSLAQIQCTVPTEIEYDCSSPRSGKWSAEEEIFANKLILEFEAGSLEDCAEGTTLRSYLAKRLNCAPMRISKKFAGHCIGKHTFTKRDGSEPSTDRESCSASTYTSSGADDHDSDAGSGRFIATMSFDTFTQFQSHQMDQEDLLEPVKIEKSTLSPGVPAYEWWSAHAYHHPQVKTASEVKPILAFPVAEVAERRGHAVETSVGLDLDDMYGSATEHAQVCPRGFTKVTPDPPHDSTSAASDERHRDIDRCTPVLGAAAHVLCAGGGASALYRTPVSVATSTWEPTMTAPARPVQPRPCTPPAALRSGAALFSPVPPTTTPGGSAHVDAEAEEWRDVLTYFCSQPRPSNAFRAWAEPPALGARLLNEELRKSASYSSLLL